MKCTFCKTIAKYVVDEEYLCQQCYSEKVRKCRDCGRKCLSKWCELCSPEHYCTQCGQYVEKLHETSDGSVCSSCLPRYRVCVDCESFVLSNRVRCCTRGNQICFVCYSCIGTNYEICDECGELQRIEDLVEVEDCFYCSDCVPRNMYPTRSPGLIVRSNSFNEIKSRRYYGIEIETDDGNYDAVPENWGIHYDGSINGMEIVSPILQGDAGLEEIRTIYRNCELEFDYKCGIHVHIDVSEMTDVQKLDLVKAFIDTEDAWFSFVNEERQDNEYCHKGLPKVRLNDTFSSYLSRVLTRYTWFNLESYRKHGTFEIRLLEGCGIEKVERWLKMILCLVSEVCEMSH